MQERNGEREIAGGLWSAPFVGRRREISLLQGAFDAAICGGGGLVMLEGEPGIGKSRLAHEFAKFAQQRGVRVLSASCSRGLPVFWPWIQMAQQEDFAVEKSPERDSGALVVEGPASSEGRVNAILGKLSKIITRSLPQVIIMDDLHRADPPSVELLGIVAKEFCGPGVLILACYNDCLLRRTPSLAKAFANVASAAGEFIKLSGLGEDAVGELIEAVTGFKPEHVTIESLVRMSGGNPRLLELAFQRMLGDRSEVGVPISGALQPAVERHLELLPESLRASLAVAAVAGSEFDLGVLRQICGRVWERTLEAIHEAERAGLIARDGTNPNGYRFVHSLIRDAICETLPGVERAVLHRQIADALADLHPFDGKYFGKIADHFWEYARNSPTASDAIAKTIEYCGRAANHANTVASFGEATRYYEIALAALDLCGSGWETERCDLLMGLALAQRADGRSEALQTFGHAARYAEKIGDANRLAQIALALAGETWTTAMGCLRSPQAKALLERSFSAFESSSVNPLKALVAVRLAAEFCGERRYEKRVQALLQQAREIARRSRDTEVHLAMFRYKLLFSLSKPDRVDERIAKSFGMQNLAAAAGKDEAWCEAFAFRVADLLRRGDVVQADAEAAAVYKAALLTKGALFETTIAGYEALRAFIDGRFEDGERKAWQFLRSTRASNGEGVALFVPSVITAFRELDKLNELADFVLKMAERQPWFLLIRASLAQIHLALGEIERARVLFHALADHGFSALDYSFFYGAYLATLAELCVELDEREYAPRLYEALLPHRNLNIVFGQLGFLGPAHRYLGMLATMLGRFKEAKAHLLQARCMSFRTGAQPWAAYASHDYARMILVRNEPGGSQDAVSVSTEVLNTALGLGMKDLQRRASVLRAEAESANARLAGFSGDVVHTDSIFSAPQEPSVVAESETAFEQPKAGEGEGKVFRREGDYWTIVFEGKLLRLKHVKGLSLICCLLRHPEQEFLASTLETLASGGTTAEIGQSDTRQREPGEARVPVGGSTPALDASAKASYACRLLELRDELEEAKSLNDLGKASKIQAEMDFLARELDSAGSRKGGTAWASEIERYRVNVTNAIRNVVRKIRPNHPSLARYLATTIKTGRVCSFGPDQKYPGPWLT